MRTMRFRPYVTRAGMDSDRRVGASALAGESGQAGNGAALLGAMGASGFRDGGSAWVWFWETSVHREPSHLI